MKGKLRSNQYVGFACEVRIFAHGTFVQQLAVVLVCAFVCALLFSAPSTAYAQQEINDTQLSLQAGSMQLSSQADGQDIAIATQADKSPGISWHRIYGTNALDTMLAIVKQGNFPKGGCVVLATADGYWDALTANGVAGFTDAPIVMTASNTLSNQAKSAIQMLEPKRIIICGGSKAISSKVESEAKQAAGAGAVVARLWGQTADETAVDVYRRGYAAATGDGYEEPFSPAQVAAGGANVGLNIANTDLGIGGTADDPYAQAAAVWSDTAFICTDDGYWDALSIASGAYARHSPIFLTRNGGTAVSQSTIDALKGHFKHIYVVGGSAAVSDKVIAQLLTAGVKVEKRIWGQDALDTSVQAAKYAMSQGLSIDNIGVATTGGYWDALAGAALCGHRKSVLVLAGGSGSSTIKQIVDPNRGPIENGYVFGGPRAVSASTYGALLGGNGLQRVLGFTREEYINSIFSNWSSRHTYAFTPYKPLSIWNRYNGWDEGLYWPRGLPSPTGAVGMNCAGFVARTIYDMECDMWNDDFMSYWWDGGPKGVSGHWCTVTPFLDVVRAYGVTMYEFPNKAALLRSGLAERGDLIAMECWGIDAGGWDDDGNYHYCGHDCHIGIFWGDTPSDDLFLHCAPPHCTQTRITPVCWGSTYHLIKFD